MASIPLVISGIAALAPQIPLIVKAVQDSFQALHPSPTAKSTVDAAKLEAAVTAVQSIHQQAAQIPGVNPAPLDRQTIIGAVETALAGLKASGVIDAPAGGMLNSKTNPAMLQILGIAAAEVAKNVNQVP